eukprot:COSAG02_NODE_33295_length_502_cov_0.980149_1_plen_55_part_10
MVRARVSAGQHQAGTVCLRTTMTVGASQSELSGNVLEARSDDKNPSNTDSMIET